MMPQIMQPGRKKVIPNPVDPELSVQPLHTIISYLDGTVSSGKVSLGNWVPQRPSSLLKKAPSKLDLMTILVPKTEWLDYYNNEANKQVTQMSQVLLYDT